MVRKDSESSKMNIFKQYTIPFLGGIKEVLASALFYVSAINFFLIIVTAYNTTLKPFCDAQGWYWFNLPLFFIVLIGLVALMMLFEFKFVYPSAFKFRNNQEYQHQNLLRKDIEEIKKTLERIESETQHNITNK
jgi:type I restriction-modification system DNA methylase subunit